MNSLTAMLFTELDGFSIIILAVVVYKLMRTASGLQNKLLAATMVDIILFLVFDLMWGLTEYGIWTTSISWKYFCNIAYFIAGTTVSFLWFLYCQEMIQAGFCGNRRRLALVGAPFAVYLLLAVSTPVTHFFFYMDASQAYRRGGGYWVHLLIAYSYIAVVTVKMLWMAMRSEHYANRLRCLTLAGFALPPMVASILQIFAPLLPLQGPGMTLAVFLVFINLQELQISRDQLTGINNRVNLIGYLESKMRRRDRAEDEGLHLMMVDVDYFKRINDKYGHTEGDAALVRVAVALKNGCDADCFVARYGGDEFSVLCEGRTEEELAVLCERIRKSLEQENDAAGTPYRLALSIGCATYRRQYKSIPEFIAAADRALYLEKEQHHRAEQAG